MGSRHFRRRFCCALFSRAIRNIRLLACCLVLWLTPPALANTYSCSGYAASDEGQQIPPSMWSKPEYFVDLQGERADSREGICARYGSAVKRGARYQGGTWLCFAGCNPVSRWHDGPLYYCETQVDDRFFYTPVHVQARSRCAETSAQLTGPQRIRNDLKGTEQGVDLTLRLSEHARYFAPQQFQIDIRAVTSDRQGPDNRVSDAKYGYLSLPPMPLTLRVDDNGEYHFKFLPHNYFLSRPIQRQTLTVTATCNWCQTPSTWNIHVGPPDVVIGFFNGVANTEVAAQKSLGRLRREFGSQHNEASLKYEWFYNQTACGEGAWGKPSCLEDVAEVFEQRSRELGGVFANRWETFWDILTGRHGEENSITGRLSHLLGAGGNALLQWLDATASAALNQLTASTLKLLTLFSQSPTYENRATHLERLQRYADGGANLLLVAHSQGNLFVNSAYDAILVARPDAVAQVVHVAPASPTLRGDYLLASIDLVINGLRLTGANSVPPANITLPPRIRDATGHGFEPTYLDTARAAYARTRGLIVQSLDTLTH